ncbi:hypothetical protein SH668x_000153 [Planctomicrobium sp. SH668]|uniref:hypothetical protein n=1 Tax=Planctomicrobium sp. SH668 TaxID=3448126 RepID=UPI003F5B8F28
MNDPSKRAHKLPAKLEKILASLSVYFGQKGKELLQKLIVNSRYYVEEETGYDNWNNGQWYHTVHFQVPTAIYFDIFDELSEVAEEIKVGIGKLNSVDDEFIEAVRLEVDDGPSLEGWREKSGVFLRDVPSQPLPPRTISNGFGNPVFCESS